MPPHDEVAEAGVLGCVVLSVEGARGCFEEAASAFGDAGGLVFYVLKHRVVWEAMVGLYGENRPIDLITLQARLKDTGNLEEVGGLYWLSKLADAVPSAVNLPDYIKIVWDKYTARAAIREATGRAAQLMVGGEVTLSIADDIQRQAEIIVKMAYARATSSRHLPKYVRRLGEFAEDVFNKFFGKDAGKIPGDPLPFPFPFQIRDKEMTFFIAEKGAGKSTTASYLMLYQSRPKVGRKLFIASMEEEPKIIGYRLVCQLLGRRHFADTDEDRKLVMAVYQWLHERVWIYDFLGIADWRQLLDASRFAWEHLGIRMFLWDSVMRLGIPDDDYAQQGLAAAQFSSFCMSGPIHGILVNHLNKSDRDTRQRSRGSGQWVDHSHNVLSVHRNEDKGPKVDELREKRHRKQAGYWPPDESKWKEGMDALADKHDSYLDLINQRYPGSRQNARVYLWFDPDSLQVNAEGADTEPVNWYGRWTRKNAAGVTGLEEEEGET